VAEAETADGREAVLKVTFPEPESEHEAAALAHWNGDGAVRLGMTVRASFFIGSASGDEAASTPPAPNPDKPDKDAFEIATPRLRAGLAMTATRAGGG
jgi:hypothetical protein